VRGIEAVEERLIAANRALDAFLGEAMAEIRSREPDWQACLDEKTKEADALREEAAQLLTQAEAKVLGVEHLRRWVHRNATGADHWLIPFDELPIPITAPQPDLQELEAWVISHV
jgi:hypothetical protein